MPQPVDIKLAKDSGVIKNGTLVAYCTRTGKFQTNDTVVKNTPIISDIESKYLIKFDDPSYYHGDGTQGT